MKFSGKQVCIMVASSSQKPKVIVNQEVGHRASPLKGVQHDINMFRDMFKNHPQEKVKLIHTSIQNGLLSKKDVLDQISEYFSKVEDTALFFYTGHGHNDNGDLMIETKENPDQDRITLVKFIELWVNRKKNKNNENAQLLVFMDSCHSGFWCQRMESEKQKTISIFSSCDRYETSRDKSTGGLFFNVILGKKPDFGSNYQVLREYQAPRFISRGQTSGYLAQNHLKLIQSCLLNAQNITGDPIVIKSNWTDFEEDLQFVGNDGKHKFTEKNGDKYDGQWKNGKKNGQGRMQYTNKQVYVGGWKDNRRHGSGKINFRDGQVNQAGYYEGEWKDDLPHGYGVYEYGGGHGYKGYWKQGQKHGKGQEYSKGYSYIGIWEEDQIPEFRNAYNQFMKSDPKQSVEGNQFNLDMDVDDFNYLEFEQQN